MKVNNAGYSYANDTLSRKENSSFRAHSRLHSNTDCQTKHTPHRSLAERDS